MGNFDLQTIKSSLDKCYASHSNLCLTSYISAYEELNKLFGLLGSVFGFVASDVTSKLEILKKYQAENANEESFKTIYGMLRYEKESGRLNDKEYVSGSRTLLRLHRALDFIVVFLEEVTQLQHESSLSNPCYESYRKTLANYHPGYIRLMVRGAVYTLPSRQGLLNKIKDSDKGEEYYLQLLTQVVEAGKKVFSATESFYSEQGLHELP